MNDLVDIETWRQMVSDSLTQLAERIVQLVPALVSAAFILLVGYGVSKLSAAITSRAMRRFGFDRACTRLRITESLRRAKVLSAPSVVMARIVQWVVFLVFVLPAAEALGLDPVTMMVDRALAYLPRVASAALVMVLGVLLARFVRNLVQSAGAIANLSQTVQLGVIAHAMVVLVTGVLALGQLGVETDILVTVVTVLVATLGLTFGAAFALGARPLVTHILAGHTLRTLLPEGKAVEVGGRPGVVERVGAVDTLFRDGDKRWSMANAVLLEQVIVQ